MNFLPELISNKILISGAIGWALAQLAKTLIYLYLNKNFRAERLFGSGGMPSSHSATVMAVCTSTLLIYGVGSFEFAMTFFFALVVMHDAMGVRRETGNQAKVLNEMMEVFEKMGRTEISADDKLKEFVGHTPLQVLVGGIMGVLIALIVVLLF